MSRTKKTMMSAANFDKAVMSNISNGMNRQDAFWAVNDEEFTRTGEYHYSDYNSYRVARYVRMRNVTN